MAFLFEPVTVSLAPNLSSKDVWLAFKLLLAPWLWRTGQDQKELKQWLGTKFSSGEVFLFSSGREALWALVNSLDLCPGDEVIIQAFTCVAVPNAVRWAGLKPVYADIDPKSYNLDPADLEDKISPKTKAIIIQHSFGIAAKVKQIKEVARKHRLYLIEDCAHGLGAETTLGPVGTLGDLAMLSFGRDKAFSGVWGGAVISYQSELSQKLKKMPVVYPSRLWIVQQLLHPLMMATFVLPFYCLGLGKLVLYLGQKARLLSLPVTQAEKQGTKIWPRPRRMANALARLTLFQLQKFDLFINHRRYLAGYYQQALTPLAELSFPAWNLDQDVPLRVPLQAVNAQALWDFAKKRCCLLGRWYARVIDPIGADKSRLGYQPGSCPQAEKAAKTIINLPSSPRTTKAGARRVTRLIKEFYEGH